MCMRISIHKALAGLDIGGQLGGVITGYISIHKALAGLDPLSRIVLCSCVISIHKALAGLDRAETPSRRGGGDFNPQGPRGPRRPAAGEATAIFPISIHKALAGLDAAEEQAAQASRISIHKALAGLDHDPIEAIRFIPGISIHKALAGLDAACAPGQARQTDISIHKALAGLDGTTIHNLTPIFRFQSTRPSRASTLI